MFMLSSCYLSKEELNLCYVANCFTISSRESMIERIKCLSLSLSSINSLKEIQSKTRARLVHLKTIKKCSLKQKELSWENQIKENWRKSLLRCLQCRILKTSWKMLHKATVCDGKYIDKNESNLRSNVLNLFSSSIDFRPEKTPDMNFFLFAVVLGILADINRGTWWLFWL